MANSKKKQAAVLNVLATVAVIAAAFWYFTQRALPARTPPAQTTTATTTPKTAPPTTANQAASSVKPGDVTAKAPVASDPPTLVPKAFPADQVTVTTGETNPAEIPPDIQAQINAPPPALPDDLKRQLNAPPPELPADLKAQLNAPPRELPEDIKRALQIPPRVVTIDEVNNPKHPANAAALNQPPQQGQPEQVPPQSE